LLSRAHVIWQSAGSAQVSAMADDPVHPLQPRLEQLEVRLESTLQEVCEDVSISDAQTPELIRIEEALAFASEVAKQAVSLRRRIDADGEGKSLT
jgi:hypothetical protein